MIFAASQYEQHIGISKNPPRVKPLKASTFTELASVLPTYLDCMDHQIVASVGQDNSHSWFYPPLAYVVNRAAMGTSAAAAVEEHDEADSGSCGVMYWLTSPENNIRMKI